MDKKVATEIIAVIRREKRRRLARVRRFENSEVAYDLWQFRDTPFVNELCLMMLVTIHHQVERDLVKASAKFTGNSAKVLIGRIYRRRVREERARMRAQGMKTLIAKLKLSSFAEWNSSMRTLQLLANCFKHSPSLIPDRALLKHLKMPLVPGRRPVVTYAPLPESDEFRERLAKSLALDKDADYCAIAEEFLARADSFLKKVEAQPGMSPVKWGAISLARFQG
jgi:hypothetical protein